MTICSSDIGRKQKGQFVGESSINDERFEGNIIKNKMLNFASEFVKKASKNANPCANGKTKASWSYYMLLTIAKDTERYFSLASSQPIPREKYTRNIYDKNDDGYDDWSLNFV